MNGRNLFAETVMRHGLPDPPYFSIAEPEFTSRDIGILIDLYLERAGSRNHGLDMLCLFAHVDRDRVGAKMDLASVSARPTFHYRLPDCRIGDPNWSLALEWNRWVAIERLSEDHGFLAEIERAWQAHRDALTTVRGDMIAMRLSGFTGQTISTPFRGSRMIPDAKPEAALFGFPGRTTMVGRRMARPSI